MLAPISLPGHLSKIRLRLHTSWASHVQGMTRRARCKRWLLIKAGKIKAAYSLHLCPWSIEPDQIVTNSLFADGAIRVDVSAYPHDAIFEVIDTFETLVPDTETEMAWRIADSAFKMKLSHSVPKIIAQHVNDTVRDFLKKSSIHLTAVAHFAIHPGGPKIIDGVAACLSANDQQIRHSREILRTRGNMSSCTLPHIWAAQAADQSVKPGDLILSLAFGPGLTLTGNVMRKVNHA